MIDTKFKTRTRLPIALDIGHNSIKMLQLAVEDGKIDVVATGMVYFDPGMSDDLNEKRSFIVSAIKKILAENNFRGRNVVSCLPNGQLRITTLRLDGAKTENIEQALADELSSRFTMEPDGYVFDYIKAGDVRHGDLLFAQTNVDQ